MNPMNSEELNELIKDLVSGEYRYYALDELQLKGDERALIPMHRLLDVFRERELYFLKRAIKTIKKRLLKKLTAPPFWRSPFNWIRGKLGRLNPGTALRLAHEQALPIFPYLLIALLWGDKSDRMKAVTGLGTMAGQEAAKVLVFAFQDDSADVRDQARSQLIEIGADSHSPIFDEIARPNHRNQEGFIMLLGELENPRAIPILISSLFHDRQIVREAATKAIVNFKEMAVEDFLDTIKELHKDPSPEIINVLRHLIQYMSLDTLSLLLRHSHLLIRREAVAALGSLNDEALKDLLLNTLDDPKPAVRAQAANALGQIASKSTVEPLFKMLNDPEPSVRNEAGGALGKIGDRKAIEPLATALDKGHYSDLPDIAIALSKFGDSRALLPLYKLNNKKATNSQDIEASLFTLHSKCSAIRSHGVCEKCFSRSHLLEITSLNRGDLVGMTLKYIVCKNCKSNLYLNGDINLIRWVLDRNMQDDTHISGPELNVNALKYEGAIEFDEVLIIDADDYDVEKFVLKMMDDMDDTRRNGYGNIPAYLSPGLSLSPAKLNLLQDHFDLRRVE